MMSAVPGEGGDIDGTGVFDDAGLQRLDQAAYVEALLTQVQSSLGVDTIAVLMLDRGGRHLVARLARGIEEEVHQGVRVPVGAGFAGRIAATRSPVELQHVG